MYNKIQIQIQIYDSMVVENPQNSHFQGLSMWDCEDSVTSDRWIMATM